MSVVIAMGFVFLGLMVGSVVRTNRRVAAANRYRCPWDRPWPERQRRLRQVLVGPAQWIDTEEIGMPPEAVEQLCAAVGWRVQAAFEIDGRAWMLWVVPPTPAPVTVAPRRAPATTGRTLGRLLLLGAVGLAGATAIALALNNADSLQTSLVLAFGVVLGVLAGVASNWWRDPLMAPRRVIWADLTAQFDAERVLISAGQLPNRYHVRLVPQLAESLGYRPTWGGSGGALAFERDHHVRPSPSGVPRRWTAGP